VGKVTCRSHQPYTRHDAASLSRRPSYVQICQREFRYEVVEAVGDNLPDFKLAAHLHKVGYSAKSLQLWPLEVAHANLPITECLRMTGGVDAHRCPFPEKSALNVFTEAVGASPAGKDRQGM
jgi:hypothetical protein